MELFIQAVGVFPTGTLVELNTGEVGIVIGQNRYQAFASGSDVILDPRNSPRGIHDNQPADLRWEHGKAEPTIWITRAWSEARTA